MKYKFVNKQTTKVEFCDLTAGTFFTVVPNGDLYLKVCQCDGNPVGLCLKTSYCELLFGGFPVYPIQQVGELEVCTE